MNCRTVAFNLEPQKHELLNCFSKWKMHQHIQKRNHILHVNLSHMFPKFTMDHIQPWPISLKQRLKDSNVRGNEYTTPFLDFFGVSKWLALR